MKRLFWTIKYEILTKLINDDCEALQITLTVKLLCFHDKFLNIYFFSVIYDGHSKWTFEN